MGEVHLFNAEMFRRFKLGDDYRGVLKLSECCVCEDSLVLNGLIIHVDIDSIFIPCFRDVIDTQCIMKVIIIY